MAPWSAAGRMSFMPRAYPTEFRDDFVAVAQRSQAGVTIKQIVDDFGIVAMSRFPPTSVVGC